MVTARAPAGKRALQDTGERLLVRAAQADPSKFDALYERNFERVYIFIARRVRDRSAAEDLTSEVFHKALANLPTYERRDTPFVAWLYRIASNAMADHFKRAHREQQAGDDTFNTPDAASVSSKEMKSIEHDAFLFRLVEKLPENQRRVICERFIEERNIKEIARRLNKTEGAVKQLQFRGVQTLREQMGDRHA